jgi:hypothetical protein
LLLSLGVVVWYLHVNEVRDGIALDRYLRHVVLGAVGAKRLLRYQIKLLLGLLLSQHLCLNQVNLDFVLSNQRLDRHVPESRSGQQTHK